MTAVVGIKAEIKGETRVIIASDSLVTRGWAKVNTKTQKIIPFPFGAVGFCGIATFQSILLAMRERKTYQKLRDRNDVLRIGQTVFKTLKRWMDDVGESTSEMGGELILATPDRLFTVDKYSFVVEQQQWAATGSGEDAVNSVMQVLYPKIKTEKDLINAAHAAIEAACSINASCGLPVQSFLVKEMEKSGRSKKNS